MSGRALARGVLTVSGARILGLVITLVQVKLTVTYLGPTAYGLLLTATMFVNSFGAWTDMGMGSVVVRRISGRQDSMEGTVGLSMSVSVLLMIPLFLATNVVGLFMYPDKPEVLLGVFVLSFGLLASSWLACFNPIAQVTGRFGHYAAADLIGRLLSITTIVLAVVNGGGLLWFFLAQLFVPVGQMLALMNLGRLVGRFRPVWRWPDMWSLVVETAPMTYIAAVGVLYFSIDGVMLSKLSTPEMVGAYGLAYRMTANFTIISTSLASVLAGRLAADAARSKEAFATTFMAGLRAILLVAVPLATLVGPLAPDLIRFVGSEDMVAVTSGPLALVAVGVAIGMLSSVVSVALISDYQQRVLTILNTFNLVLNIVLNAILIPQFGAVGAGWALVVSELNGLVVCFVLLYRRYGVVAPFGSLVRLVPVVLVCLGVETLLQDWTWPWRIGLVGLTYVAALFVFRAVRWSDIKPFLGRGTAEVAA